MMNKLALMMVVTVLGSQAAGCIIEAGYDDDFDDIPDIEVATISARWSLRNMSDGATTACPAGFDTAEVISQAVDDEGVPLDEPVVDLFDCSAGSGFNTDLFPDVYQSWVEIRSNDLTRMYAQSLSQVLDVRVADQRYSTDILNDGGYFQLGWELVGADTNRALDCTQVPGLDTVQAISTSVADADLFYEDVRRCDDHFTVTEGLLQGTYTVQIEARAGDRTVSSVTTLADRVIKGQNQVTDLGEILIPIAGR